MYFCIMKSFENKSSLISDLFFCLVFMPALLVLGPAGHWLRTWPLFFMLVCVYLYGVYFFIKKVNLPRLLVRRRWRRVLGALALLLVSAWLLTLYPLPAMDFVTPAMSRFQTRVRDYNVALSIWLMLSLVSAYGVSVSFVRELYRELLSRREIENQRDKAKLAILSAQISPHFMFNTLNSLYSLVLGTSQKAEDAFIKFTELLKYTYVTIEKEAVPLSDEIMYIQHYIDLQAIRLNEHTRIDWSYDADATDAMIPPMLLLTFVENCFKYGASTSRDCVVAIRLSLHDGRLDFSTENRIMKHSAEFPSEVPVGIGNSRARLSALFPDRYSLETFRSADSFRLHLTIDFRS